MNLDLANDLLNNLKESKIVQNFIKELSKYLENNNKISNSDFEFNDLHLGDLTLYGEKVITKYRDEMLTERANILQEYSKNTEDKGEMYYIYATNSNDNNSYNLCICNSQNSHDVITKSAEELPNSTTLGSVLRKQNDEFVLDTEGTKTVGKEINTMIKEKIEEQMEYLESKRVEGHIYEVGEKDSGRIWLYDLNNTVDGGIEGIEEIKFPEELYKDAQEGDRFIFQNGEYQKFDGQAINNNNKDLKNTETLNKTKSNSLKQEGCLYQVVDMVTGGAYLQNLNNNRVSKETDIPKDVLNKIGEDSVLRFKDGQYVYEEALTEKFRNSLIGIKEYMDIKQKFINETNISEIAPNTEFKIESYGDDYCLLSYGDETKNTIEVPKTLIPFWAKNGDILCYKDGKFERKLSNTML